MNTKRLECGAGPFAVDPKKNKITMPKMAKYQINNITPAGLKALIERIEKGEEPNIGCAKIPVVGPKRKGTKTATKGEEISH